MVGSEHHSRRHGQGEGDRAHDIVEGVYWQGGQDESHPFDMEEIDFDVSTYEEEEGEWERWGEILQGNLGENHEEESGDSGQGRERAVPMNSLTRSHIRHDHTDVASVRLFYFFACSLSLALSLSLSLSLIYIYNTIVPSWTVISSVTSHFLIVDSCKSVPMLAALDCSCQNLCFQRVANVIYITHKDVQLFSRIIKC